MSQPELNDESRYFIARSQGPRDEQQDAGICLHDDEQGTALLVVGDGVGGRSGGRIASQKVTELASQLWEERKGRLSNPEEDLAMLCRVAHEHINSEGARLGISPRTTIVALYLTPTEAHWVHSGDSRLYHFRERQLVERTEDHSLLEIMVQRGAVKEEDMGNHPDQGTLLQSLGGEEYAQPSTGTSSVTAEDAFLLCTDGFWERTKPEEMIELAFAASGEAGELLTKAVERAVERNGPKGDNVTVAIALPGLAPNRKSGPVREVAVAPVSTGSISQRRLMLASATALFLLAVVLLFWPSAKKEPAAEMATPAIPRAIPITPPAAENAAPSGPERRERSRKIPPSDFGIRDSGLDDKAKATQ